MVQEWKGCIYAAFGNEEMRERVDFFEKNSSGKQEKNKLKVRKIHFDEVTNILDGYKMNYV